MARTEGVTEAVPNARSTAKVGALEPSLAKHASHMKAFLDKPVGKDRLTLLMEEAMAGRADRVLHLIKQGSTIDQADRRGATALHHAAASGSMASVTVLLDHGANINACAGAKFNTPLLRALCKGHSDTAMLLLQRGADIYLTDRMGISTLSCVEETWTTDVMAALIEKNASLDPKRHHRALANALANAASVGNPGIVKQLLQSGVGVDAEGEGRSSALFKAAANGRLEVAKILLDHKASCNKLSGADDGNLTPLAAAADGGHAELVKLLLEKGADVHLAVPYGVGSPLDRARHRGHAEIVALLEQHIAAVA